MESKLEEMAEISTGNPVGDKGAFVRDMFATIAPRYDRANRVLTGGLDEIWRRRAIALLAPAKGARLLDLCCGTGDLSFHLLRHDGAARVTGIDFCEPMLAQARERARRAGIEGAEFLEGDVTALPFPDESFDGAIMGFSSRNIVDLDRSLQEIRRVLRPGARFVNLDVSKAPNRLWKRAFDFYFYGVVPTLGGWIGGSKSAYSYLPQSLVNHPNAPALRDRFTDAGFLDAGYLALMGGSIAVHYGTR